MKDRVSILIEALPRYGEILLGVGSVALESYEALLENEVAREELKKYLIKEAPKSRNLLGVSMSENFQRLMYNYIGKFVNIGALRDEQNKDTKVNILLFDFFDKSLWPIIVNKYIDNINEDIDKVVVSINIKRNVYLTIYEEETPEFFFKELKEFLLHNHIVICEAKTQLNGDLLVRLMLPIPPHKRIEY